MARFANTIDNQPIYAARAEADKNGDRIDTTYLKVADLPAAPVQDVEVDGTSVVNAQGVAEITMPTVPTATSDLTNDSGFITASDVAANQAQADWTESSTSSPSYIQHKPDMSIYAQSSSLATVATTGDYDDLIDKPNLATVATSGSYNDLSNLPSIPAAQVNSDWDAVSGVSQILNKPNLATVATTGSYNDLSNKPSIPPAVTVDQHYDALSDNPQSGTAVAEAIAGTGQVPTVTSADDNKVLMASYSGGVGSFSWEPSAAATQVNSDWDATSGVAKILNKPDLSVYAESADLATVATTGSYNDLTNKPSIPAAQVNADWDSVSGVSQILNKPSLATVATSGNYNDLSNKPSIPAAQVNADWDAVSGVSQILNKPNLATVATSGSYNDLSNKPTIPDAPVQSDWTESDSSSLAYIQNKPTLATVATSGSYADLSNKPTIPTVDQSYSAISTNAQSGTAVADALSYISQVPSTSQASAGDVLTVDSNGDPEWSAPAAQEQSDWTESDPTAVSYIQHKPSQKTLVGGQNVVLTESANNITIDCTASGGSTYTAGDGIAISAQDVISVDVGSNLYIDPLTHKLGAVDTLPAAGYGLSKSNYNTLDVDTSVIQEKLTAGSNVSITNNVISATGTTYSAGDGIAISNSEISVNYDSDTLEVQQTPPVTHESYLTSYNSSGMSNETYGETPVDMIDQIGTVPVTVSIPGNTFWSWYTSGQNAVIIFKTNYNDFPNTGAYCATPLSYTQDPNTGKFWIDEQDVVITALVGNATPNYFTFGYNGSYLSSDVWSCDTLTLSEPIVFSYSTAAGAPEIAVKNPLPASAVGDAGKVLKVNASGTPEWATGGSAQVQADWTESSTSSPAYIQHKPNLATVATSGDYADLTNLPTIPTVPVQDVEVDGVSVLNAQGVAEITMPNIPVTDVEVDGTSVVNASGVAEITLPTFTQAQADWTEADSSDPSYIQNKPTLATVATSGSYNDLADKPTIPSVPVTDVTVDGVSVVSNGTAAITMPSIPVTDVEVDGVSVLNAQGVAEITMPTFTQAQADWTESDSTDPSYIQNKPTLATVATSGAYSDLSGTPTLATVATSGSYADLSNKPTIPTVDQVYDGTSANAQSGVAVASALSGKQDTISDLSTIRTGAGLGSTAVQPSDLATVATTGDYSDLLNTPTIPAAPVQSNWTESDSSSLSYIQNKPSLAAVATSGSYSDLSNTPTINNVPAVTSSDDAKVLKASYTGGVGSYSWETESGGTQVQSDWTESDTTDPSFIQNKPTVLGIVAGANVTITEGASNLTIAATDTTYTAGTGLTLSNGEFSVDSTVVAMQTDIPTVPSAGNMLSVTNNVLNVTTTAGITDIQQVSALPAQPVATVLYLIPET